MGLVSGTDDSESRFKAYVETLVSALGHADRAKPFQHGVPVTFLGLSYVVGVQSSTGLWAPGTQPLPPKRWRGIGRPPSLMRRDAKHKPVSAKQLALALPKRA